MLAVDLASDPGELLVTILFKVAEMERRKMMERTNAGKSRAKAQGLPLGRERSIEPSVVKKARETPSIAEITENLDISIATVERLQKVWHDL